MTEFEDRAQTVLEKLQRALASIIGEYGDPAIIRPVDICEFMGIDMNLAWKVSRLVNSTDVFSLGKYLPGRKAIGNFCVKALESNCSSRKVNDLREASIDLEKLKRTYAGSRKELEIMLANLSVEERAGNDSIHRRKSFEGNCYTFGIQSDVQLSSVILTPARSGNNMLDICRIRGHIGLFLIRPDVPWRVASTYILDSTGKIKSTPHRDFLFPINDGEPPLVREFCSAELPDFGSVTSRSGRTSYFLKGMGMGKTSAINLFTAEVIRDTGILYRKSPDDGVALNNSSRTPTRKIVVEVFMPGEFSSSPYQLEMWSRLFCSDDMSQMTPGDLLPLNEQPVLFSAGRAPVPVPGVPEYCNLIESCFHNLGEDPADYRLLRLTVDYPPIPSSIDVLLGLPEKNR